MIRICICDDDQLHSSKLEKIIMDCVSKYPNIALDIDIYGSGATLLNALHVRNEEYQILFLDIEMDSLNGIEVARKIRETDKSMIIIYVTSYAEYTMESFEVSPFRYILKPIDDENISKVLLHAVEEITRNNQYLFFKSQNLNYQIKSETILSISSLKGRIIHVVTCDNEFTFYGTIKDVEDMLDPLSFIKVNQGTMVNLNYIHIISGTDVILTNKEKYAISRGQKKIVKDAYNHFIKRRIGF
ncbi:LytR/AlgR family response regulator transcription factor [Paenibacillus sp. NPDC056722]|uniref:LytR/AlgR family response regulator transcription factor n=1 Tax=Paenibacillus sp. NPDC056722 TaxID=3345924 RepID=UPI0036AF0F93